MSGGFKSVFNMGKTRSIDLSELGESSELKIELANIMEYDDLKKATNNFEIELGRGAYGTVYKGRLKTGKMVAVKKLMQRDQKVVEEFLHEVNIFSSLDHNNLVSLLGCTTPHGRGQKLLLVYELVSNGTVADHLHGQQQSDLPWTRRIEIAVQTADAIAYLHARQPPIIHRDLKTGNILLDNNFQVKVADLGISRILPWNAADVSTMPQGTEGYRDPEYNTLWRLSDKTDVYSFGVVLMELVSKQKAVDAERGLDCYLHAMASRKITNNKLEELVDPELGYLSNVNVRRMVDAVVKLASECLQFKGSSRPHMAQVLTELKTMQQEIQHIGADKFDAKYSESQLDLGGVGGVRLDDNLPGYYDIFQMEVVAGDYSMWFARGSGWEYGEVDLLDLCYQESTPANLEKVLLFSKENTKLDIYARIPQSALMPGKKYQLYMSVYLRAGAKVWQHPLQVRGVGISHLVPSGRLPTDSRNVVIEYDWANFVVAEFWATTAKAVAFNIFDRTGQYMNDFYLRGFGYYPL